MWFSQWGSRPLNDHSRRLPQSFPLSLTPRLMISYFTVFFRFFYFKLLFFFFPNRSVLKDNNGCYMWSWGLRFSRVHAKAFPPRTIPLWELAAVEKRRICNRFPLDWWSPPPGACFISLLLASNRRLHLGVIFPVYRKFCKSNFCPWIETQKGGHRYTVYLHQDH